MSEPVAVENQTPLKLDPAKLLGFRNLVPVIGSDADIESSSELAFNKRGTETAFA